MNVREMTVDDVGILNLWEEWMKQVYQRYLETQSGNAWILEDENGPICAFGGAFLWPGNCEIWFNLIRKAHPITIIRTVRRYLEEQSKRLNVRRVQATSRCDSIMNNKFLKSFGLKNETPDGMAEYNPDGSDAYMYARLMQCSKKE